MSVRYRAGEEGGRRWRKDTSWWSWVMTPSWGCWVKSLTRSYYFGGKQNPTLSTWNVIFLSCEHFMFTEKLPGTGHLSFQALKSSFKSSIMNSKLLLLVPLNSAFSPNRNHLALCSVEIPRILRKHWVLMHVKSFALLRFKTPAGSKS